MQHDGQTDSGRGNLPASVASNLQRDDVPKQFDSCNSKRLSRRNAKAGMLKRQPQMRRSAKEC